MESFLEKYSTENLAVLAKIPRIYRNKRTYRYTQDIVGINPEKISKRNICRLKKQLLAGIGLSKEEKLKKGDHLLTVLEKKLVDEILKTQWTLKHITVDYELIKRKGNTLKSLQQRLRENHYIDNKLTTINIIVTGKNDNVFFTLGSPQHKGAGFLQDRGGYVISIDVNSFFKDSKLNEALSGLQFSDHWAKYLYETSFLHAYGNVRREIKFFNDTAKSLTLIGHKQYCYYRDDGTILTRTVYLGQEAVVGEDVFPFIAYNLVLELRYIGGQYRQHILNNLDKRELIEASIDSLYQSHNFEATIPSQVPLHYSHIKVTPQGIHPANTRQNALLMHEAISKFDMDTVKSLLAAGVPIEIRDSGGKTPLIHALLACQYEIAGFLIEQGADCEKKYQRGHSALAIAIVRGRRDILEKMVSKPIRVDSRDATLFRKVDINRHTTAISEGVKIGYLSYFLSIGLNVEQFSPLIMSILSKLNECMAISSINLLFEHGTVLNYGKDKDTDHLLSETLLSAIHGRKLALLHVLIRWGCNVNYARLHRSHAWFDKTPLMLAVKSGALEIVKLLVESGAEINKYDKKGRNALTLAEEMQYQDIIKFLKQQLSKNKIEAFQGNNKEIAKALVYGKSSQSEEMYFLVGQKCKGKTYELLSLDHDKQDFRGENLEQLAVKAVFSGALIDLSKYIALGKVEKELFSHFQGKENNAGLVIETHKYWVHDIKLLRPYPTPDYYHVKWIRASDIPNGRYVISPYDYPMIESLINNQPFSDTSYLNCLFQLNTQLFAAIENDDLQAVASLLSEGTDVNSYNDKMLSPLAIACDTPQPNLALIQALINAGARVNQACAYGDQELVPLQLALLQKSKLLIVLLGQNGANTNQVVGTSKLTALLTACELEKKEMIQVLVAHCGANFEAPENKVALSYICSKECTDEMFDYLLDRADINGQGPLARQLTPLMVCTVLGDTGRMSKLLEKGADPSIHDPITLKTALDFAYETRNLDVIKTLPKSEHIMLDMRRHLY